MRVRIVRAVGCEHRLSTRSRLPPRARCTGADDTHSLALYNVCECVARHVRNTFKFVSIKRGTNIRLNYKKSRYSVTTPYPFRFRPQLHMDEICNRILCTLTAQQPGHRNLLRQGKHYCVYRVQQANSIEMNNSTLRTPKMCYSSAVHSWRGHVCELWRATGDSCWECQ